MNEDNCLCVFCDNTKDANKVNYFIRGNIVFSKEPIYISNNNKRRLLSNYKIIGFVPKSRVESFRSDLDLDVCNLCKLRVLDEEITKNNPNSLE